MSSSTNANVNSVYGWKTAEKTQAHDYLLPGILSIMPAHGKVLDIGAGNGALTGEFAKHHEVLGLELSDDGIGIARRTFPNIQFEQLSAYDDLSHLGKFDIVISAEVVEHLYDPACMLRNAYQVLEPGGVIILTTPYHGYLKNLCLAISGKWDRHLTVQRSGGHIKFFSRKTLETMLKSEGFVPDRFVGAGRVPYLWKSMIVRAHKPRTDSDHSGA